MSTRSKRKAAKPAEENRPRTRGRIHPPGALNEDMDVDAIVKSSIDTRAFWNQFHNEILYAWLADFDGSGVVPSHITKRETLLDKLVSLGVPPPKDKKNPLPELHEAWRHTNDEDGDPPSYHTTEIPPAAAKPAAALIAESVQWSQGEGAHIATPPTPKERVIKRVTPTPCQLFPPAPELLECGFCLAPNAPTASGKFMCSACSLRGDLDFNDPINIAIRQARAPAATQVAAPVAPPTPTGQASMNTTPAQPRKTLWEEALTSALEMQRDTTPEMFSPDAATKPHDHERALSTSRLSYGATACQNPHPLVVQLIRTGRLDNVGHAIPHMRPLGAAADWPKEGSIPLEQGGGVRANTAQRDPPPMSTPFHFISALLSTILPSLVDMPDALYEWIAFSRTIFEIHRLTNWETAARYMNQIVPERINRHDVKTGVLAQLDATMLMNAQANSRFGGARGSPSPPSRSGGLCRDWNVRECHRDPCDYRHDCLNTTLASPCLGGHRVRECPKDSRNRSGGKQRPRPAPAASTPTKTPAAKP